jgi:hypothetical protein
MFERKGVQDRNMTQDPQQLTSPKSPLACPICGRDDMKRVSRHGFLQTRVFPLFGFYPWECSHCRAVQLFKNRGRRRRHR